MLQIVPVVIIFVGATMAFNMPRKFWAISLQLKIWGEFLFYTAVGIFAFYLKYLSGIIGPCDPVAAIYLAYFAAVIGVWAAWKLNKNTRDHMRAMRSDTDASSVS